MDFFRQISMDGRKLLSDGEIEDLNRKLSFLHSLTYNGREARKNAPAVTITCFEPCLDIESEWYGRGGQYREFNGTVLGVEPGFLRIKTAEGETAILFDDIREMEGNFEDCTRDLT